MSDSIDPISRPYWDGVAQHELRIQRCSACEAHQYLPGPLCRRCGSTDVSWVAACGRGRVYSATVIHRPPPGASDQSYVVGLIELREGPLVLSRLVGSSPPMIGDPVELTWEHRDGRLLPAFTVTTGLESEASPLRDIRSERTR